jgi:hypothetical protein
MFSHFQSPSLRNSRRQISLRTEPLEGRLLLAVAPVLTSEGSAFDGSELGSITEASESATAGNAARPGADFNGDGQVDHQDIDLLGAELGTHTGDLRFDLTLDGIVDQADMDMLIHTVLDTNYGDANLDGMVNLDDYSLTFANLFTHIRGWQQGNFNSDPVVDGSDVNIWNSNKFLPRPSQLRGFAVTEKVDISPRLDLGTDSNELRSSVVEQVKPNPIVHDGGTSSIPPMESGDFNSDGLLNDVDIDLLTLAIRQGDSDPRYDLNLDGTLNREDLDSMIHDILGTRYGDANLDGSANEADLAVLQSHLFGLAGGWANGDFNGDAVIDGSDFGLWNANKFTSDTRTRVRAAGSVSETTRPERQIIAVLPVSAVTDARAIAETRPTHPVKAGWFRRTAGRFR